MRIARKISLRDGFVLGGRFDRTLNAAVPPLFPTNTDEYWMEQAILTAMEAIGWSAPNPSVGAVLVDPLTQTEISRGFTQAFRHEHAEREAIQAALKSGRKTEGATLYVTLEPCSHQGNQPPCADLVAACGIGRVVIGSGDPDPRVSGQGTRRLRDAGIEVVEGVLEDECRGWHHPFLRTRDPSRRIVWAGKWAQTASGELADWKGDSKWISNPKSRAYTHWLRQRYDAILVTAETWLRDQPRLDVRDCAPPHRRNPLRIVLDRSGRLDQAKLDPSVRRVRTLDEVETLALDPPLQSVMVEGGPTLLNALIQSDRLDVVHQFTGLKRFDPPPAGQDPDRYRIRWAPDPAWYCAAQQKIDGDHLQEWVKSF